MMKKSVGYLLAAVVLSCITVSAALLQGRLARRWDAPSDTTTSMELLNHLPREFGEWEVLEERPLSDSAIQILQCAGYTNRVYVNRRTSDQVSVTLLLGPSGPMTVHTPEVCLTSHDFEPMGIPSRVTIAADESTARFYYSMFRSTNPTLPSIEVFYGWSNRHGWEAPDAPRFAYGGVPLLFKLQVISQLWPNIGSGESGFAAKFLSDLLRALPKEFEPPHSVEVAKSE